MAPASHATPRSVSVVDLGLLLFLGAVWGGAFLFLRVASPEVGPVWVAEIRIALAAVILAIVAGRRTLAVARGRLLDLAIVGVTFSALPFSLIAFATLTLPTGYGALINASTPLFTALLGVAWLGQRLSGRVVAGLVAGLAAVLVLVGLSPLELGPRTLLAVAAALGTALSYAFAGTFVRRRLHDVGGTELATAQLVSGAILLLPIALLSGPPGVPSGAGAASVLAIATLSTALAWPLFFRVLSRTTPTAASTVTFIVPAFGIAWGALALGEPIGPELVLGFGLIMVSLVLVLGLRPSIGVSVERLARRRERALRSGATA